MAALPESGNWEEGIYQIEETDVVRGGPVADGGTSNRQALELANRTKFLYDQLSLSGDIEEHTLSADITLQATHLVNKLHIVRWTINSGGKNINVNLEGVPDRSILRFIFEAVPGTVSTCNLVPTAGYVIKGTPQDWFKNKLPVYFGETVSLMKFGGELFILNDSLHLENLGGIVHQTFAPLRGIKLEGQLVQRIAYPRLWQFAIASYGTTEASMITDAQWLQNGIIYKGAFSSGNGTSNFRLPDLRGMFIRGKDNGAGVDLDRQYSKEGGGQADQIRKHTHGFKLPKGNISTGDQAGGISEYHGGKNPIFGEYDGYNTKESGGVETRPVNVAYTAYIKY